MKLKLNPFKIFTKFELILWGVSLLVVTLSFVLPSERDILSLLASLVGVTALIYNARGNVMGQILSIAFSLLYGIISLIFGYYGEAITYLCMTLPMAVICLVSWFRHPYKETSEVKINSLRPAYLAILVPLSAAVSVGLYFLLGALGTQNLVISTLSVTTSFFAASLTFLRTPYFALAYAVNDVVLITLWVDASLKSPAYISMVVCFLVFLINDTYSFINWMKMRRRQRAKM